MPLQNRQQYCINLRRVLLEKLIGGNYSLDNERYYSVFYLPFCTKMLASDLRVRNNGGASRQLLMSAAIGDP